VEGVVLNTLAKKFHSFCRGSRVGCNTMSSQATRLPLQNWDNMRTLRAAGREISGNAKIFKIFFASAANA
jgi:hypothetical protein